MKAESCMPSDLTHLLYPCTLSSGTDPRGFTAKLTDFGLVSMVRLTHRGHQEAGGDSAHTGCPQQPTEEGPDTSGSLGRSDSSSDDGAVGREVWGNWAGGAAAAPGLLKAGASAGDREQVARESASRLVKQYSGTITHLPPEALGKGLLGDIGRDPHRQGFIVAGEAESSGMAEGHTGGGQGGGAILETQKGVAIAGASVVHAAAVHAAAAHAAAAHAAAAHAAAVHAAAAPPQDVYAFGILMHEVGATCLNLRGWISLSAFAFAVLITLQRGAIP